MHWMVWTGNLLSLTADTALDDAKMYVDGHRSVVFNTPGTATYRAVPGLKGMEVTRCKNLRLIWQVRSKN